ncbi:trypsin beta [Aedes albopictus]|uniref:Peptidase S1 domain-containing protein n=1 Tax=Aedes albopictus TaxID=7160 RepID=A0ABM1XJ09_AEDAL
MVHPCASSSHFTRTVQTRMCNLSRLPIGKLFTIMIHTVCLALFLASSLVDGSRQLTVQEVLDRVHRLPPALENVVARVTNEVNFRKSEMSSKRLIVGGEETSIEAYPYQVAILYSNVQFCGGSIISDLWVLTAAHCLDWKPKNADISIRSGSSSRSTGGTIHAVYYYHIHEQYDPNDYPRDVATVRVKIPFSAVTTKTVPLTSREWSTGYVTITGWGKDSAGKTPDILTMVAIPVVSRTACNTSWDGLITDDMICAGDIGSDSCDGDSGGPAVQDGIQYGIVSWGGTICGTGLPGVYTNIAHPAIRDFIKRTTMM